MQLPHIPQHVFDAHDGAQLEAYRDAMIQSGAFFTNGDHDVPIVYRCSDSGIHTLTTPAAVGKAVLDELHVQVQGARGAPLYLNLQGAYHAAMGEYCIPRLLQDAPVLRGTVRNPAVYLDQGRLWQAPQGYVPATGLYYVGAGLPGATQPENLRNGCPLLFRAFSDIHFTSEVYRVNFFGYLFATLARASCREFPILILDATSRKQGKSTVASAIHYLLTGQYGTPITHTGDEQEFEKRLATYCNRIGPNVMVVDNIRPKRGAARTVRSQFLSVATTNPTPGLRGVYKRNVEPVHFPIVIFTVNGASLENDLADRAVRVVLTGEEGRFFEPSPLDVIAAHREEILSEMIGVLTGLDIPDTLQHTSRMGTFERVASTAVQAVVSHVAPNWNPDAVDVADAVVTELYAVVRDLQDEDGGAWPTLNDVAAHVRTAPFELPELTAELRRRPASTTKARARVLAGLIETLQRRELHIEGSRVFLEVDDGKVLIRKEYA